MRPTRLWTRARFARASALSGFQVEVHTHAGRGGPLPGLANMRSRQILTCSLVLVLFAKLGISNPETHVGCSLAKRVRCAAFFAALPTSRAVAAPRNSSAQLAPRVQLPWLGKTHHTYFLCANGSRHLHRGAPRRLRARKLREAARALGETDARRSRFRRSYCHQSLARDGERVRLIHHGTATINRRRARGDGKCVRQSRFIFFGRSCYHQSLARDGERVGLLHHGRGVALGARERRPRYVGRRRRLTSAPRHRTFISRSVGPAAVAGRRRVDGRRNAAASVVCERVRAATRTFRSTREVRRTFRSTREVRHAAYFNESPVDDLCRYAVGPRHERRRPGAGLRREIRGGEPRKVLPGCNQRARQRGRHGPHLDCRVQRPRERTASDGRGLLCEAVLRVQPPHRTMDSRRRRCAHRISEGARHRIFGMSEDRGDIGEPHGK